MYCLIDHGADIFLRNLKGVDVLFMAILYGVRPGPSLDSLVTALRRKGVDLNKQDSTGAAPLHVCAAKSLPGPVHFLVEAGASVNAEHGVSGLSPLHIACSADPPDPVRSRP